MSQFYLVAPLGYCINQQVAAHGVERLQQAGHEVAHQQAIPRRQRHFAGTGQERLADINQLVQLPGRSRIVLAAHGGYGANRLLPHIDWQGLIARQQCDPLLICGHSDFIAIQSGLLAAGSVITSSGSMFVGNFGMEILDPLTEHHSWQALRQAELILEWSGEEPDCQMEGILWGGNLAMLTSLIGTSWLPAIRDGTPAVEDINEHPFRVGRMLLQLLHSGVLATQRAVIFGSFASSVPNDYDAGYDLPQVFDYLCQQFSLPSISGLEFGHEQCMVTPPLGACVWLVNQAATTTLTISGYLVLTE